MIGNRYAIELVQLLESKQVPADLVLQDTDLEWGKVQAGSQTVRKHHMQAIIRNSQQLVNEPDLGLQYGKRLNASTHGILGFALMNASSLSEMVQIWLRYHSINHPGLQLGYRVDSGIAVLGADIMNNDNSTHIFAKEVLFASVYSTLSFVLNERPGWTEFWFDYPEPAYADKYAEVFNAMPRFGQSQCQMRAPAQYLDRPLPAGNPASAKAYQQQCAEMLRTMRQRQGVAQKVQKLLLERSASFPKIAEIASLLLMSERTLRRRLDSEGTSFQEVYNDVRHRLATEYLRTTSLGVADISELLGFADPSNFRRAFIQWSGQSPAQFRKALPR